MNPLLSEVLDSYGGLARWHDFSTLSATVVTDGEFLAMKGVTQDSGPRQVSIDIHRQWGSLSRFGDPYWHVDFTPEHVSIVAHDGRTVADRDRPRAAFYCHTPTTPWDLLDRAYFHGCALWTYLTVPFVFAQPGFKLVEICPLRAGEDIWRGLRVRFPDWIATHSREQDFYFGPDRLLRRHDYQLDVAGGLPAAQLVSEFTEAQGIRFPIFQRAYRRGEDMTPLLHRPLVSMNLDDFVLR